MHPNEVAHLAILAAFQSGDLATAARYYADDARFHLNGRGPFAGERQGFAEFVELFSQLMGGIDSYRQEELDVVAGDQHAVALLTSVTTRGGRVLTSDLVTVLTWSDGKVVDERIVAVDPYSTDAFYE